MADKFRVRTGVPEDVHEIMSMASDAFPEMCIVTPDNTRILELVWSALNQDHGICGVLTNEAGKIEGGIILKIGKLWYSNADVLEDKILFIHKDYRKSGGGRARRLCEYAKTVSNELKMPLLVGVFSNNRTEGKVRLYERQFGKMVGGFFLYGDELQDEKVMES
jgi:hypothetical protein